MKVQTLSHLRGLGPPMLVSVDTKSTPGKIIVHFVRMETIAFNNDANWDNTKFMLISEEADKRAVLIRPNL